MRHILPRSPRLIYGLSAFASGLLFIVLAYLLEAQAHGGVFSIADFVAHHREQPLLYLIDLIPFVIGAGAYRTGMRIEEATLANARLSSAILANDENTMRQFEYFDALVENTTDAVVQIDNDLSIISFNDRFVKLFGYSGHELVGAKLDELIVPPEDRSFAQEMSGQVARGGVFRSRTTRMHKTGRIIDVEIMAIPAYVGGRPMGAIGFYTDISEIVRAEQAISDNEARFRSLFVDSPIALWEEDFSDIKQRLDELAATGIEDLDSYLQQHPDELLSLTKKVKVLDVNQAAMEMFDTHDKEVFRQGVLWDMTPEAVAHFRLELMALYAGRAQFRSETELRRLTGELFHVSLNASIPNVYADTWERVYVSMLDISERIDHEERLRYISFHDALTGLANRMYFEEEMQRVEGGRRYPVTLMICDLDDLKGINDTHGHEAGDAAIRAAAYVLRRSFRSEDMIARIGGDEFAAILPEAGEDVATAVRRRLPRVLEAFNNENEDPGMFCPIVLSYGVHTVQRGESLEDGLRMADKAMYAMKLERRKQRQQDPGK